MNIGKPNVNAKDGSLESPLDLPSTGSENCLRIGTRLAEFEITGIVGEGGFGTVYLAFDHSLQRTVAIKEYMPAALASRSADNAVVVRSKRHKETFEAGLRSFINEARLLAQFDHSALIKVYRFWEQNKTAYMVMRYYEGQTFKSMVRNDPALVTEAWLKPILKPILEALEVLYKIQILHRDISPDNIMIQTNGEAVLLDFGAARQLIGDMTQTLTVILKPGYAPVEQYADDSSMKQGPWTDIYALSAVIYSAIVKRPPPTSVARLINDPIEPLRSGAHSGFSIEFLSAIDKGLAVKPEDRPQSIEEFSRLLGIDVVAPSHADTLSASASPSSGNIQSADTQSKPVATIYENKKSTLPASAAPAIRPWTLALAGVVLAAATGGYLLLNRSGAPAPALSSSALPAQAVASQRVNGTAPNKQPVEDEEIISWETLNKSQPTAMNASSQAASTDKTAADAQSQKPVVKPKPATTIAKKSATDAGGIAENSPRESRLIEDETSKMTNEIKLTIKPWGNVMVDGVPKGVSPPLKRLALAEGKHQIKIMNPNFPDHVVDIMVNKKKSANIEYDFAPVIKN